MPLKSLPVGYWIKEVDRLLTEGINEILSAYKVNRTDWQIMNLIFDNPINLSDLLSIMHRFADQRSLTQTLSKLEKEKLIEIDADEVVSLSGKGAKLHRACLEKQQEFRQRSMLGISEQEYAATINTLQRMAENMKDKVRQV